MKIYKETWEDNNGIRLDIAFTKYEMKKMPYEYRFQKRNFLAEEHGFDIKHSGRVRELELDTNKNKKPRRRKTK